MQITLDALRGGLPSRFYNVIGDGGFRYLMEQGVNYRNAHYQHANTETIVGHASLATGTVPAAHGMVGNVWFDREENRLLRVASSHGSPWRYGTFVPVVFAGAGLSAIELGRSISPYDIAPTLANYLKVKAPSGAIRYAGNGVGEMSKADYPVVNVEKRECCCSVPLAE